MMDDLLTLSVNDLKNLSPIRAISFTQDLIWAEAYRMNIPLNKINISTNLYTPDGGIDATITSEISEGSFLTLGLSSFQVKTGDTFKPTKNIIKREFFGRNPVAKENLGNMTRRNLDENGTYILLCFGVDLTSEQQVSAITIIKEFFAECGYNNSNIEIWSQNNIISFAKSYPSICFNYKIIPVEFQTYLSWNDAELKRAFVYDSNQQVIINSIRDELRCLEGIIHIRVLGEPGVGKTRLVYESINTEELKPLVIYTTAKKFKDSNLMYRFLIPDYKFKTILILDECDKETRTYIWDKFKFINSGIKIITIFNEDEESVGTIKFFIAPNLQTEAIINIFKKYGILHLDAERWVEICGGSPRVAHIFAENIIQQKGLLNESDTAIIWDRFIYGNEPKTSQKAAQIRTVFLHLALFKKFGFGNNFSEESECISKLIREVDITVTPGQFNSIIADLKRRKILQGEYTLYISPKALHIKLWIEWWNTYGSGFNFEIFLTKINASLQEWYFEMFKYANESRLANKVVSNLLSKDGPFNRTDLFKNKTGGTFFLALSEANPNEALSCLENFLAGSKYNDIVISKVIRRDLVWALERIVIWNDLFQRGSKILLRLAEAENESYSNNATGTFINLFQSGSGRLSPTEAPLKDRLPILIEALNSPEQKIRYIAYQAAKRALDVHNRTRMIGAEYQGLKKEPQLWRAKSSLDVYEYLEIIWNFLINKISEVDNSERKKIISVLLEVARSVASISYLNTLVYNTFDILHSTKIAETADLVPPITRIIHFEGKSFDKATRERWIALRNRIVGTDYQSLLKRYLVFHLIEDEYNEDGKRLDMTEYKIKDLAKQTLENKHLFINALNWLIIEEGINANSFGFELGKLDYQFSLLDNLVDAYITSEKRAKLYLLNGYFKAIFEIDINFWENTIKNFYKNKNLRPILYEIITASGLSEPILSLIIELHKNKFVQIYDFKYLSYSNLINNISFEVFVLFVDYILNTNDDHAGSVAVAIINHFCIGIDNKVRVDIPEELLVRTLTHKSLLNNFDRHNYSNIFYDPMDDYYWTQLASILLEKYPDSHHYLTETMVQNFGTGKSFFSGSLSKTCKILDKLLLSKPTDVWSIIKLYLGPPIDDRAFYLRDWLRGGEFHHTPEGLINYIPFTEISKWIDEDIENRAWNVAGMVTPKLFREENKQCSARDILIKYGNREDVKEELYSNFSSEGWTGPASLHYLDKKNALLQFMENETDINVINWIVLYVDYLDKRIESAKIEEERRY